MASGTAALPEPDEAKASGPAVWLDTDQQALDNAGLLIVVIMPGRRVRPSDIGLVGAGRPVRRDQRRVDRQEGTV
jgi:hypothetical protein